MITYCADEGIFAGNVFKSKIMNHGKCIWQTSSKFSFLVSSTNSVRLRFIKFLLEAIFCVLQGARCMIMNPMDTGYASFELACWPITKPFMLFGLWSTKVDLMTPSLITSPACVHMDIGRFLEINYQDTNSSFVKLANICLIFIFASIEDFHTCQVDFVLVFS